MMTFTIVVIMSALASVAALTPITDANINEAVALWKSDKSSCNATYGHISTWDTGSVTNMDYLFCGTLRKITNAPCPMLTSTRT